MSHQKWSQFLADVQIVWLQAGIKKAKNFEELTVLVRDYGGMSHRHADREIRSWIQEFQRKLTLTTEIERSATA